VGDNDGISIISNGLTVGDNDKLLDSVTVGDNDGLSNGLSVRDNDGQSDGDLGANCVQSRQRNQKKKLCLLTVSVSAAI
jgi:hypothetical protein